jgi:SAM-dependent methyltransferase
MPRVSVHAHDAADPGTPGEGTYDAVVSMNTLYWHSRPEEVLAACRRALRPGGLAVVLTYARPAHVLPVARSVFREHGVRAALNALRWLVPTALFERARAVPRRYCTAPELRGRLADAGFAVVGMRPAFLGGIMHLAWARPVGVLPSALSAQAHRADIDAPRLALAGATAIPMVVRTEGELPR